MRHRSIARRDTSALRIIARHARMPDNLINKGRLPAKTLASFDEKSTNAEKIQWYRPAFRWRSVSVGLSALALDTSLTAVMLAFPEAAIYNFPFVAWCGPMVMGVCGIVGIFNLGGCLLDELTEKTRDEAN